MKQTMVFECPDEAATQKFAETIADITRPGDVWALSGTLGVGKSVWARALIQRLCNVSEVPSPTFTLVQNYETAKFEIFHFDLYRLKSPEEIWELNIEEALYSGVSIIEWPEKMGSYLPRKAFQVHIKALANGCRQFAILPPDEEGGKRLLVAKEFATNRTSKDQ